MPWYNRLIGFSSELQVRLSVSTFGRCIAMGTGMGASVGAMHGGADVLSVHRFLKDMSERVHRLDWTAGKKREHLAILDKQIFDAPEVALHLGKSAWAGAKLGAGCATAVVLLFPGAPLTWAGHAVRSFLFLKVTSPAFEAFVPKARDWYDVDVFRNMVHQVQEKEQRKQARIRAWDEAEGREQRQQ